MGRLGAHMTICFFSAQYLPTVGGVERYTYNLARRVVERGHRAVVVTSSLPGLPQRETGEQGIEIVRLPAFGLMQGRFPLLRPDRSFRELARSLWMEIQPDVIVANNLFYALSIYAAFEAKKRNIPALLINHGTQYLMTGNPLLVLLGRWYEKIAARMIKKWIHCFCAVSGTGADWLQEAFSIKADGLIYNAVEPQELQKTAAQGEADWRARLGIPAGAPLIGFSGRVIPEKGAEELCEAVRLIRREIPDAVAVLAGDGSLLEKLRAENLPGVYFAGQVSYPDSLSLICQSDIFCLPTRSEGFASTVLEAAALGTPVVTTPTGGSVELILDDSYGRLIPDRQPQTIAQACAACLLDAEWRATAAGKAYARLCGNFVWDRSTDALLEKIREICGQN